MEGEATQLCQSHRIERKTHGHQARRNRAAWTPRRGDTSSTGCSAVCSRRQEVREVVGLPDGHDRTNWCHLLLMSETTFALFIGLTAETRNPFVCWLICVWSLKPSGSTFVGLQDCLLPHDALHPNLCMIYLARAEQTRDSLP